MLFIAVNVIFFALLMLHARHEEGKLEAQLHPSVMIARELRITDLCLFTEARYTRHPAMADLHSPFQDHPFALEHFPSGSLVAPPPQFHHDGQ